jgi:glycosyltransferase involved in cell wall biosynthesis
MATVSVILPTRNRIEYLRQALDSVLVQTRPPEEIFIIDDGSDQPVSEQLPLGDPRVRVLRHARSLGVAAARNAGIRAATGELIAQLDDDDWWASDYLAQQTAIFDREPRLDVLAARCQVVDAAGRPQPERIKPSRAPVWRPVDLLVGTSPLTSGTIIRRDALLRVGGYDESLRSQQTEDIDLYARLSVSATYRLNQAVLVFYRQHGANWTANELRALKGHLIMCERMGQKMPAVRADGRLVRYRARGHYLLGRGLVRQRRIPEALVEVSRAVWLDPGVGGQFAASAPIRWIKPYVLAGMLAVLAPASLAVQLLRRLQGHG